MPLVTALITTFNRSAFLKKAIESVLAQTFRDFELIILDNSSTDDTEEVIKGFGDKRIRHIRHEPMNISQARNLGVREARGEYIAFLDDDDEWLPHKIEVQVNFFERAAEDIALVYGAFIKIDSEGNELGVRRPTLRGKVLKGLIYQDDFTGSASNPMIRRSVVMELGGYDEKVVSGEDWELYLRIADKYRVDFTLDPVVRIRSHEGPRLGDKLLDTARLEIDTMARYRDIFEEDKRLKSFYLQKIGGKFVRVGKAETGRGYIAQAIKANPSNYVAWAQFLLSFLGQELYLRFHKNYLSYKKRGCNSHEK